jgi:hypothetical protein
MNFDTFTDNHLCNFSEEQLYELFDWEAADLHDNPVERQRILWLSQFLVGNISETLEEIKELDSKVQWATFDTWISVIKDVETLRSVTKRILYRVL